MQNLTTPTPACGAQPHEGQTRALPEPPARLALASLTFDPAFTLRASGDP